MIYRFSTSSSVSGVPNRGHVDFRSDMEKNNPLIQLHDDDNVDHDLAAGLANELVNISGAQVSVYIRTDHSSYDNVWEEEPAPTYKSAKRLKAYFVPEPIKSKLTLYGVDVQANITIMFSRSDVFNMFRDRMIRVGDVIDVPYNGAVIQPGKYRVTNAFDMGNFRYKWLYWACHVENITDDITIDPN